VPDSPALYFNDNPNEVSNARLPRRFFFAAAFYRSDRNVSRSEGWIIKPFPAISIAGELNAVYLNASIARARGTSRAVWTRKASK